MPTDNPENEKLAAGDTCQLDLSAFDRAVCTGGCPHNPTATCQIQWRAKGTTNPWQGNGGRQYTYKGSTDEERRQDFDSKEFRCVCL